MAKKSSKLSFEEIQRLVESEISVAEEHNRSETVRRKKTWNAYYGEKLGNEVKGRSQFISKETQDTIEWMMPYFIKTFASGDSKVDIEIKGQEPWVGKALMEQIQTDLADGSPNLFTVFYQWFKAALVSDTAEIKLDWDLDYQMVTVDFAELDAAQMQELAQDEDITILNEGQIGTGFGGIVFKDVQVKIKKIFKDGIYVENLPYWEFLIDPKAKDINDGKGKGHKTEVTLDYIKRISRGRTEGKTPYFKNLDKLESGEGRTKHGLDQEDTKDLKHYSDADRGPKAPTKFIEWYTKLDVDGDGYLEDIICFLGNGHLLRWETLDDNTVPFCSIKPIIDCYKYSGISYAELVVELQNLNTMLFRRILDNFDFQNSGRWLRDPNSGIDMNALLYNVPGGVVTGKVDGLKDITPTPFNPSSLSILEYVKTVKEERTGITRYNQGTDATSLNQTARGIMQIQNAAMQRMELVARIFAEGGVRDFYQKCVKLYQQYLRKPFVAKVYGEDRQVTREMIQGKVIARVNMGVTASVGIEESQRLEKLLGLLFNMNERFPGLLTPEKVHNIAKRFTISLGFKQADDFISSLNEFMQQTEAAGKQQQETQQALMQFEQKLRELELSIKGEDVKVKAEKVKSDREVDILEIEQEEKDSQRDHQLGLLGLMMKGSNDGRQV